MSPSVSPIYKDALRERVQRDLLRDPGMIILAYPYARSWRPIPLSAVKDSWTSVGRDKPISLYVHIPFCRRKCAFCDFLAYYDRPNSEIDEYLGLLRTELRMVADMTGRLTVDAIQFGGGTPSLLSPEQISSLMDSITSSFRLPEGAEVALEVFPDWEVSGEYLRGWKQAGVNRLSFGVQCFDDAVKRGMGRTDDVSGNMALIEQAIKIGYANFNIDLMCGVLGQTMESWSRTLDLTLGLKPGHVCVFPVSVRHPGTHFYVQRSDLPPAEATRRMYNLAVSRLGEAGFQRTTRHDFARPGFEYRYERMIAELTPLVGVGANCINYSKDCIYRNHSDLSKYASALRRKKLPVRAGHIFQEEEKPHNYAVRNIEYLLLSGQDFKSRFGVPLRTAFEGPIALFEELGLARMTGDDLVLTDEGVYLTSAVKRALFHPSAWERFDSMKPGEFAIERGTLHA
jgi:oxygen-independent coproporphyrinogen III oxidase